jgi:hypothetical protein
MRRTSTRFAAIALTLATFAPAANKKSVYGDVNKPRRVVTLTKTL